MVKHTMLVALLMPVQVQTVEQRTAVKQLVQSIPAITAFLQTDAQVRNNNVAMVLGDDAWRVNFRDKN